MKLFKKEQGQPVSVDTELPNTTLSMGREKNFTYMHGVLTI